MGFNSGFKGLNSQCFDSWLYSRHQIKYKNYATLTSVPIPDNGHPLAAHINRECWINLRKTKEYLYSWYISQCSTNPLYRSVCDTFQTTRKSGFDYWWEEKGFLSPVMGPIQLPIPRVPRNLPWGIQRPRSYISLLVVPNVRLELDLHNNTKANRMLQHYFNIGTVQRNKSRHTNQYTLRFSTYRTDSTKTQSLSYRNYQQDATV